MHGQAPFSRTHSGSCFSSGAVISYLVMSHSSSFRLGRREFIAGTGAVTLTAWASRGWAAKAAPISFGYAAITWGDAGVKKAIAEISEAGFPGVQLRSNILKEYTDPAILKAELAAAKLTFACYSGGGPGADPAKRAEEVEKFMVGAKFAIAAGAKCIQATSPKRTPTVDPAALKAFGETLTAIGKQTAALGVPLGFHNHMDQLGQNPEDMEAILAASDPKYVKLLLDTGHYVAAGGDPAAAIKKHGKRLVLLHIKDVSDNPHAESKDGKPPKKYQFVELGKGKADFAAIYAALKSVGFKGWTVVELDSVPTGRAPKDAAVANKAFLEKTLSLKI
jgi:inosose dehydratase